MERTKVNFVDKMDLQPALITGVPSEAEYHNLVLW